MYVIMVGAGGIGSALIDLALKDRHDVAVVERDPRKAEGVTRRYDVLVVNADAAFTEVIRQAGGERADALITTTSDDATNLMVIAAAADLGVPSIVSVVNVKEHVELFRRLGAHVMENPDVIVAEALYNAARRKKLTDLVTMAGGAQIFRMTITRESPLLGKSLLECGKQGLIPSGILFAALERDGEVLIPSGPTVLQEGDVVTVYSKEHVTDEFIERLAG
ncbi:MAG: TrkA family potassium uptake protein [Candidatus Bipolaricaulota bacterium]